MSLLALVNLLRDCPMQRRFMACPLLQAADLLFALGQIFHQAGLFGGHQAALGCCGQQLLFAREPFVGS